MKACQRNRLCLPAPSGSKAMSVHAHVCFLPGAGALLSTAVPHSGTDTRSARRTISDSRAQGPHLGPTVTALPAEASEPATWLRRVAGAARHTRASAGCAPALVAGLLRPRSIQRPCGGPRGLNTRADSLQFPSSPARERTPVSDSFALDISTHRRLRSSGVLRGLSLTAVGRPSRHCPSTSRPLPRRCGRVRRVGAR